MTFRRKRVPLDVEQLVKADRMLTRVMRAQRLRFITRGSRIQMLACIYNLISFGSVSDYESLARLMKLLSGKKTESRK